MGARPTETTGGLDLFAQRYGIDADLCDALLGLALERGGDYADLFFEYRRDRRIGLEDQRLRGATSGISQGLGVRVIRGEVIGYASTNSLDPEAMRQAARTAATIAAGASTGDIAIQPVRQRPTPNRYPVASLDEPAEVVLTLLRRADVAAWAVATSIEHVTVSLDEQVRQIAIATSNGLLVGDSQPLVALQVSAVSVRGSDRQQGYRSKAARAGLNVFADGERSPEALGRAAAEWAVQSHDAVEAPTGFLPVVLAPGDAGILLHEAVGHSLEADNASRGLSVFSGRLGQTVASPLCTVVDDGALPGQGSLNVDDEGHEARRSLLIERGTLRRYLHDRQSARRSGVEPSGNGRRQDFSYPPMPRMTTTFMLPGESDPDEIVRSVQRGIYCHTFSGGMVKSTSGDFAFSTREAYLIEDGRITAPIRSTNLIGNGLECLRRVTLVGNDLRIGESWGNCGKRGQWVPVGVGLPTVLIDGMTVGGTRS